MDIFEIMKFLDAEIQDIRTIISIDWQNSIEIDKKMHDLTNSEMMMKVTNI